MEQKPPRAFLSHSHEDKEIAQQLAGALRQAGVDTWLDKWEIKPGDSIVEKIFEEGLKDCALFLILLSQASVQSPWVKHELDAAIVQRLDGVTRVVPVVLEPCEVPVALRPLFRIDLQIEGFSNTVNRLVDTAFGRDKKPALGPSPRDLNLRVSGLTNHAARVAVLLSRSMDQPDGSPVAYSGEQLSQALDLDPQQVNDAVEELESLGLVKTLDWLGTYPYEFGQVEPTASLAFQLKGSGALDYDPEEDVKLVAAAVVQKNSTNGEDIRSLTKLSPSRINQAVSFLEDYNLVNVHKYLGTAPYDFGEVVATGATRRFIRENS